MVLDISQNFIKYDHVKEIEEYIKRNAFMDKSTVRDEFKTIKFTVIPNVQEINK